MSYTDDFVMTQDAHYFSARKVKKEENSSRKVFLTEEPSYLEGAHIVIRTDGVYFPKIYQVIHRKIKNFNSKGYKRRNRRVSFHKK